MIALTSLSFQNSMYNVALFWIPLIREQYLEQHDTELLPVKANDVAFRLHALTACSLTIGQCFVYERGNQRVSMTCWCILAFMGLFLLGLLISKGILPTFTWCDFVTWASYIQLSTTAIKYFPQAYMNFCRKSTEGLSIGRCLLDLTGGTLSNVQVAIDVLNSTEWLLEIQSNSDLACCPWCSTFSSYCSITYASEKFAQQNQ